LLLLGSYTRARGLALRFFEYLSQTNQFLMDGLGSSGGIGRRYEWAWRKLLVLLEGAIEPDGELPRDLQRCQCFGMSTALVVTGAVAGDADLVKEVGGLTRQEAFEFQPAQQVGLRFFRRSKKSCTCGGCLGEQLTELAELDEAGIGIVLKIMFGERPEAH
jgi:hypothetical protein